ncbi:hypothetical protein [Aquibacillus kalidii]|uniref:hypothetical protein n=1 Tax=Aquibacillus kalidii TaxID=2762597 RepID=UPI001C9951FE|nr:hypothetical protein [Aquibacillus kalidii]
MSRSQMAREQISRLQKGFSAYAESEDLVRLIKREIEIMELPVICEETEIGYWFFPASPNQKH